LSSVTCVTRCLQLAASGFPAAGVCRCARLSVRLTQGFWGAGRAFRVSPGCLSDSGRSFRSLSRGPRSVSCELCRTVPGSPEAVITLVMSSLPYDSRRRGAREPNRWSFRLVGLCLDRHDLGIPQVDTVAPSGELESLCRIRDSCPRVLRRARRSRLTSVPSASSSFRPGSWIAPLSQLVQRVSMVSHLNMPPRLPVDVCFEFPKIAPPLSWEPRSPLPTPTLPPSFRSQVANLIRVPSSWFCTTWTVFSFSTLLGYFTELPVMGFVMFHRRDSESPPRSPTLRSFALCQQQTPIGLLLPMPGSRHPTKSPWSVHRAPYPLVLGHLHDRDLEAFLHLQSRNRRRRCQRRRSLAPLGLPGLCPQDPFESSQTFRRSGRLEPCLDSRRCRLDSTRRTSKIAERPILFAGFPAPELVQKVSPPLPPRRSPE